VNRRPRNAPSCRGFTLVEVLVALMVVAIGLAALMITVSSTARTSGYLRDKTLAEWIALNRLTEVRLNLAKSGQNTDTGEIDYANRSWHYDTRYFDTSFATMKRVVVRVYAGNAKTKGNPVAESTGFLGSALATRGASNTTVDWNTGNSVPVPGAPGTPGAPGSPGTLGVPVNPGTTTPLPTGGTMPTLPPTPTSPPTP
jgi:general secretion pathway protein I